MPNAPTARRTVALVFGGRSGEHGISCVTAGGVMAAIDRQLYDVVAIGITQDGRWVLAEDDPARWAIESGTAPHVGDSGAEVLLPTRTTTEPGPVPLRIVDGDRIRTIAEVDVFFPLLHGPYGEDGTIQGLFELTDIPYVGAGVLGSAIGQDKHYTKVVLQDAGLAVAPWETVRQDEWEADADTVRERVSRLGYPQFVKPARAGSSLGVSKVTGPGQLELALKNAFSTDSKVLVESAVVGREVECGVLGGGEGHEPRTSRPGEVTADGVEFYTYASKYFGDGQVDITVPAELDEARAAEVREAAATAFRVLDLEGLSRVDFFATADGLVINEVNTMPGFTPFSMYPQLWADAGIGYTELITELIELARTRPVGLR